MTEPPMTEVLIEVLRDSRYQHFSLICSTEKGKFGGHGDQTPSLVRLMQLHQDLLIRLLEKSMVALYWNDGDETAKAILIPVGKTNRDHPTLTLKFPKLGPVLVSTASSTIN